MLDTPHDMREQGADPLVHVLYPVHSYPNDVGPVVSGCQKVKKRCKPIWTGISDGIVKTEKVKVEALIASGYQRTM